MSPFHTPSVRSAVASCALLAAFLAQPRVRAFAQTEGSDAPPPATPASTDATTAVVEARVLVAREDGVPVRSDPGFVYRELTHLRKGQEVIVDGQQGSWLRVRPRGWVLNEHLVPKEELPPDAPSTRLVVTKDGARVRSGPGTDQPLVTTLRAGSVVEAAGEEAGWWKLSSGGFLYKELARIQERVAGAAPVAGSTPSMPVGGSRRWSILGLNGVLIEIVAIPDGSASLAKLKEELRGTGVMEEDWTYMQLVVSVPEGPYRFHYQPDMHTTLVIDGKGEKYPNVYVRGPVGRLPMHLRSLFESHVVHPKERFEGVLMFRPTLDTDAISEIWMVLDGRLQRLYQSP